MITAVDSSVLLAIFKGEPHVDRLIAQLEIFLSAGRLVICDVVAAEVGAFFDTHQEFASKLEALDIGYSPIEFKSAHHAGRIHREYRKRGGGRETMVPDFLIASHAANQADQLWASDRGYFRAYFRSLKVVVPGQT